MSVVKRYSPKDGVLVVEMNRPEVRNAVNLELAQAISDAMDAADNDPSIAAIVLTEPASRSAPTSTSALSSPGSSRSSPAEGSAASLRPRRPNR